MNTMDQSAPLTFGSIGEECKYYWDHLPGRVMFALLVAAWITLFHFYGLTSMIAGHTPSLFAWMLAKWNDPANDSSHGKLIPWVVLGLLWMRRERLLKSVGAGWWPALVGLALALLLHMVGYMVQQPRLSMVALFAGGWILVGLVWGRETLKATLFPFFIFAFCVPMGGTFAQGLTLPMRLLACKGAYFVTHGLLDVRVVRDGTMLRDPTGVFGNFDVAAECSGIRSFIALLAITTIFSVLTMRKIWKRAVILSATIPLALICNILRVTTIVLAANAFQSQQAGQAVDHYFGYVTYALAMGGVFLLARLLREKPETTEP